MTSKTKLLERGHLYNASDNNSENVPSDYTSPFKEKSHFSPKKSKQSNLSHRSSTSVQAVIPSPSEVSRDKDHFSLGSQIRRQEKRLSLQPFSWEQFYALDSTLKSGASDINNNNVQHVLLSSQLTSVNFDIIPHKMKATKNINNTVVINGLWCDSKVPALTGGPLLGKYNFCQLHFHCGQRMEEQHTVNRTAFPVELHLVFVKEDYRTMEEAEKRQDGLTILTYFFMFQSQSNKRYDLLLDYCENLEEFSSTSLFCFPLNYLVTPFSDNYFSYWGSLQTPHGSKTIKVVWLICRQAMGLSAEQVLFFMKLSGVKEYFDLNNSIPESREILTESEEDLLQIIYLIEPSGTDQIIFPPK